MAIVGGAIMPVVQGRLLDATSPAVSFIVPAVCFAVVAAFAVYDLRAKDTPVARLTETEVVVVKLRRLAAVAVAVALGRPRRLLHGGELASTEAHRPARGRVLVDLRLGAARR